MFPLQVRSKAPATRRGFYDATTDAGEIAAMFARIPDATGYGVRTGAASRIIVLDLDGPEAVDEAKRQGVPPTLTVRTGRGWHLYFELPEGRELRSRDLAPQLELKAAGSYVVGPGSAHPDGGTYTVARELPVAVAPNWVLETPPQARISKPRSTSGQSEPPLYVQIDHSPGPIPEGRRNRTLFELACRLRGRGLELPEILAEIAWSNDARCTPPLDRGELAKVAESAARYAPGKATAGPDSATLEALAGVERELWGRGWSGTGELSSRDVLVSLLKLAREHGERVAAGVRVSVSIRDLALMAAVSKPTAIKAYRRLVEAGLIRKDDAGRREKEAGGFVLLSKADTGRAKVDHSDHRVTYNGEGPVSGKGLRAPLSAARLRWSGPRFDRVGDEIIRTTVRRLGKGCGQLLDALEAAGGSATVEDLAHALQKTRPRDLRRRVVGRLVDAGAVECSGDIVELVPDWPEVLARERDIAEETAAFRRDVARFERERVAYANRHRIKAEPVPERPPAGTIDELEPYEDPAVDLAVLAALAEFLKAHPDDHPDRHPPEKRRMRTSMLASDLWRFELVEGRPDPAAVEIALAELSKVAA